MSIARPPDHFSGASRYQIVRRLGAGGMGVVHEAIDRKTGSRVALKSMRSMDAQALYRFKKEFRELVDVTHPNLIALHELVSEGETTFFTMELVEGVEFLRWVRPEHTFTDAPTDPAASLGAAVTVTAPNPGPEAPPLDLARLRAALPQLAGGVHALHSAGKLHRDLKPSNVMVTNEGRVVLLDFGLVTDLTRPRETVEPQISGTVEYMAPEQAGGPDLSEATDWYAVGVMLYEALTGVLPFVGPAMGILFQKQLGEPTPPRLVVPERELPADLDALCMELLRRDPAARPKGSDVVARLDGGAPESRGRVSSRTSSPRGPLAFVGRERHLAELTRAYEHVVAGTAVSVYVHGSSGMGKSTLVERFLDLVEASKTGIVVLRGRCYERESIPYKAIDGLVDSLTRYLLARPQAEAAALLPREVHALSRVFPVIHRVAALGGTRRRGADSPDPQELRRRAFAALRELFAALAERQTVVVWIDDFQWGDVDSVAILAELLRPPDSPAMLLVATYRTEDVATSPALEALTKAREELRADVDTREIEVGLLSQGEAIALAESLGADRPQATRIAEEAAGSPYFISELVRHTRSGVAPREPSAGEHLRLADLLRERIRELPDDAARLLEVVAVAGHPLSDEVATSAAAIERGREAAVVGLLRSAHLVRTLRLGRATTIETYHDRIRETLVEGLTGEVVTRHHERIAQAVQTVGEDDPEALATHYRAAGRGDLAAEWAVRAADRAAAALAFHRAATWYRAAIELGAGAEHALRVKLGDALANAGRGKEAAEAYLACVAGAGEALGLELRRKAAEQLLRSGHVAEGIEAVRGALVAVGIPFPATPLRALVTIVLIEVVLWFRGLGFHGRDESSVPPTELARIDTCRAAAFYLAGVESVRGPALQRRFTLLALRTGERKRVALALGAQVAFEVFRGHESARAAEVARIAVRTAEEVGDVATRATVDLAYAISRFLLGRWGEALEAADRATAALRDQCIGVSWELAIAHGYWLHSNWWLGELAVLRARIPALIRDATERGDLTLLAGMKLSALNSVWLCDDDPERARRECAEAIAPWPAQASSQHQAAVYADAHVDLYEGDGARALARIDAAWRQLERSQLFRLEFTRLETLGLRARAAVSAARRASDAERLIRRARADARVLERSSMGFAAGFGRVVRAAIAAQEEDVATAQACLLDAIAIFDQHGMKLLAAVARRRRGDILGGEAGSALIEAANAFMGAQMIKNPTRMTEMLAPGF